MIAASKDDCFLHRNSLFSENIDYMSPDDISHFHLHSCWRENRGMCSEKSSDNIAAQYAFADSQRLENVAWRRWNQQLWKLAESSPSVINWNKSQDITWLYGPKYCRRSSLEAVLENSLTTENLTTLNGSNKGVCELTENAAKCAINSDDMYEVSSVTSNCSLRSMSFDDSSSVESETSGDKIFEHQEEFASNLKSALKLPRTNPFKNSKATKRKNVKFNYIVNSREFMNGLSFDYHYLDTSCL